MPDSALPEDLLETLFAAQRVVALTGAGVSAESGIPTFRDAPTGHWAKHDPMKLASPEGFARDPALVWGWYAERRRMIAEARPNAAHEAMARLQELVPAFTLITQNVDGFHALAGARDVLELHGNIQRSICSVTRKPIDPDWIEHHADAAPPPSPHHADGLARPDVVWFGEMLDEAVLTAAFEAAADCDLMLVAGTAGVVHPAASLPLIARDAGARVVDINVERGEIGRIADWYLAGSAGEWLPRIADALADAGAD